MNDRLPAELRPALAGGPARPPGAVANVLSFAWRAMLKVKHMPDQLFDMVVTPVMFTVIFTWLFGGALFGSTDAYLAFLLPGIIVQTVVFSSVYTGYTLNVDLSRGIYDRFRSMPIWKPAPIVGALLGDTVRFTISAVVVFLVGLLMGYRAPAGLPGAVASTLLLNLFALGIGWVFILLGLLLRSSATVLTLGWMLQMPVTFLSNIFVDPATLPAWLQPWVAVNPISHLVDAIRAILAGDVSPGIVARALVAPAAVSAVCAPLCMRLYERRH